ncbi:MAG: hypothetical protein AB7V46_25185 [Thermomicrobiales bacterium]
MTRPLYVAFVGMRRPPSDLPPEYWQKFVQFHLELPYYYAAHSPCHVHLTTVEPVEYNEKFPGGGSISTLTEGQFLDPDFKTDHHPYDVVVHWRKWFDEMHMPGAKNVILSQDHTFSSDWKSNVEGAFAAERLDGILVFPRWHKANMAREVAIPQSALYEGLTLGVDTDIYRPGRKDPYHLLWASDPGRGLDQLIAPFLHLWARDRRFKLTVTYPDYVRPESVARFSSFLNHPGVTHLPGLRNGSELWELFNTAGFLPYSSTFPEPSSRCHRQAMAAGSVVLYPPNMGTPSDLLEDGLTGIIEHPDRWPDIIQDLVRTGRWEEIGQNARSYAVSENWSVQARRFYEFFSKGLT